MSGCSLNDLQFADGKFANVTQGSGPTPTSPNIEVDIEGEVDSSATTVAFRGTATMNYSFTATYKIDLYNWTSGLWVNFKSQGSMPLNWESFSVATDNPNYINSTTHHVKARMTVTATSSPPITNWTCGFEQGIILWK